MFIPKSVLERTLPPGCIKAVPGGIEITAVNIVTPIQVEELPWNEIVDYYDVVIDGIPVSRDLKYGVKITVLDYEYSVDNIRNLNGKIIPVGGKIKVFAPIKKYKKGETHDIKLVIKVYNEPIEINVRRTIQ